MLEARLLLEPGVAALAARRGRRDDEAEALLDAMDEAEAEEDRTAWNDGDRRFHRRLAALTGNPVLLGLADQVAALMDQPLWQRLRDDSVPSRPRALHAAEHRMIYEAIVEGDAAAAVLLRHAAPRAGAALHDPRPGELTCASQASSPP